MKIAQRFIYPATWLLVMLATCAAQAPVASAPEQLLSLRKSLRAARDKNDWASYGTYAAQLKEFLNGSPRSLLEVARADAMTARLDEAKAEAQHILDMGQAEDALLSAPFNLHNLEAAITANRQPVSRAALAWELPQAGFLPEDIDYDAKTRRFFLTSILEKRIAWLGRDGKMHDFAAAPDPWPMLALKVDPQRRRLWATEVALKDFTIAPKSEWGRSAVLCYDLDSGKLLTRIEGPAGSALGDMALTPDGIPIVSDNEGAVYRLDEKSFHRLDSGDFISPQTATMSADGKSIFVPDYVRGIAVLDASSHQVRWLPMENKFNLIGIDGLYLRGDDLLATQNGSSPERVISFRLDPSHTRIVSQAIFESATSTLGDPTHGVVVGSDFYYIANSGWDTLTDSGERKPDAKITAPRIMKVAIDK